MEYRTLGKTGLRISRLGFGGIPIQRISAEEVLPLIQYMVKAGINYIDTARGYTVSEEYLGQALQGLRDKFVLATKSMSRTAQDMAADIDISLRNLRTDHIDLYQIHNPSMEDLDKVLAAGGAMEALEAAKAAGKIDHIGLTAHSLDVFRRALELPQVETIMFPFNIVEDQGLALIRECEKRNIGFIDMKPLAGGAIENAPVALRYILQESAVTVIIPGMATLAELQQNIDACDQSGPLSAQEQAVVEQVRKDLSGNFCRRCNYCQPCTKGINISSCFLFEGYLSRYGLEDWAHNRYAAMPTHASDCIECGLCESRCPYHLPIRNMLKVTAQKFGQ